MEKVYALNYKDSSFKNKFTILSNFTDSQDFIFYYILCLSMQRKLTHFDKELKRKPFLCL